VCISCLVLIRFSIAGGGGACKTQLAKLACVHVLQVRRRVYISCLVLRQLTVTSWERALWTEHHARLKSCKTNMVKGVVYARRRVVAAATFRKKDKLRVSTCHGADRDSGLLSSPMMMFRTVFVWNPASISRSVPPGKAARIDRPVQGRLTRISIIIVCRVCYHTR
jgi:hypothetical protein